MTLTNRTKAIVAGVSLAGAFSLGRWSAPKPQIKAETHEQAHSTEQVATAVKENVQSEAAKVERVIVYRDRVVKPDGTVREREVEKRGTDEQVHAQAQKAEVKVETREVIREVEKRVEVRTPAPEWRVGVLIGADLGPVATMKPPGIAIGAIAERRVLGPIQIGAWGLLQPTAIGISVGVEF